MLTMLASLPLLAAAVSTAATSNDLEMSAHELCRQERALIPKIWQEGLYDTSPQIAAIMVDAADGNTTKVREVLAELAPHEAVRWRQVAMLTAAEEGQAATVDALLDDGAAVNGSAQMPPFKAAAYQGVANAMAKDPHFGGPSAVEGFQASGLMNNEPRQTGPALLLVVGCGDLTTVNVLLGHHADPMITTIPGGADPFTGAIAQGETQIVLALLNHGADPCVEESRRRRTAEERDRPFPRTVAEMGRRAGLSDVLVSHLECNATRQ